MNWVTARLPSRGRAASTPANPTPTSTGCRTRAMESVTLETKPEEPKGDTGENPRCVCRARYAVNDREV